MTRILVPLDGTEFAEAAIPVAERMAVAEQMANGQGQVILLRVGELPELSEHKEEEQSHLLEELKKVAARLSNVSCELRTDTSGDAVGGILETARNEQADQIVMATHGRSGPARWAFGSVADAVVRESAIPVTLVPPAVSEPSR